MYDLTEEEKERFARLERVTKKNMAYKRSRHKCNRCPYADWINNKKVLCTYSPVNCAKDEVK